MSLILTNKANGKQILFTWIPKTGGTAVFEALRALPQIAICTAGAHESQHALPPAWEVPCELSFAAVRYPLSWWSSCFRFWRAHRWKNFEPDRWVPGRPLLACAADDFEVFMENVLRLEPSFYTRMLEWYLGPPGANNRGIRVLRQESLAEGFAEMAGALGLSGVRLPRANVSPGPDVDWPLSLMERVLVAESPTIRRFYPEGV